MSHFIKVTARLKKANAQYLLESLCDGSIRQNGENGVQIYDALAKANYRNHLVTWYLSGSYKYSSCQLYQEVVNEHFEIVDEEGCFKNGGLQISPFLQKLVNFVVESEGISN